MRCGYNLQEEGVKLLGIIIDENMDWKLQLNYIKKKIGKGNYLLWRYKKKLTPKMSKTLYDSFIRCHMTYCMTAWGGKSTTALNDLKKQIKKSWSKIGTRRMHTNERLLEHNILKFEDELKLNETKIIWRWENSKLPAGLNEILIEKFGPNLRNRNFERNIRWKNTSISYRLATRAKNEIKQIAESKTLTAIKNKTKLACRQNYTGICRTRNCFICTPR
jgi:hypothetical protein